MSDDAPAHPLSDVIGRVERELGALWESALDESPRVRVSTATLVLLASGDERDEAASLADSLVASETARTLVLTVDPREPALSLTTHVSARCRAAGDEEVCAERVDLTFGAAAAARVQSVVTTLAVADVPTVLVALPGAPAGVVRDLAPAADRYVFDSAGLPPLVRAALVASSPAALADLAWWRGAPLREAVARLFDPPAMRAAAFAIRELDVTVAGDPAAAELLVGWLADRLGWELGADGDVPRAHDARGIITSVRVTANDPSSEEGPDAHTAHDKHDASGHATRDDVRGDDADAGRVDIAVEARVDSQRIRLRVASGGDEKMLRATRRVGDGDESVLFTSPLARPTLAALLDRILEAPASDALYRAAAGAWRPA